MLDQKQSLVKNKLGHYFISVMIQSIHIVVYNALTQNRNRLKFWIKKDDTKIREYTLMQIVSVESFV